MELDSRVALRDAEICVAVGESSQLQRTDGDHCHILPLLVPPPKGWQDNIIAGLYDLVVAPDSRFLTPCRKSATRYLCQSTHGEGTGCGHVGLSAALAGLASPGAQQRPGRQRNHPAPPGPGRHENDDGETRRRRRTCRGALSPFARGTPARGRGPARGHNCSQGRPPCGQGHRRRSTHTGPGARRTRKCWHRKRA